MLRALLAEAAAFPELHRRYFSEIVTPRRKAMYKIIERGIAKGEIRSNLDIAFINDLLVAPILARMSQGATQDLDPDTTSRRIVETIYSGIQTR